MPRVLLTISDAEQANHKLVVVDGEGFTDAHNGAKVGVRVRGEDTFRDDRLFSMGGQFSTVVNGIFNVSTVVHKSRLDEDWGEDEIYAIAEIEGWGSMRSNTVRGRY